VDSLCHNFPTPKVFGFSSPPRIMDTSFKERDQERSPGLGRNDSMEASDDGDGHGDDDALSTSSSVSLVRLRFVVASALAIRDEAVETRTQNSMHWMREYLSRSMIALDGDGFIGEARGLDGCSRDTLDFFVAYNPDNALMADAVVLQDVMSHVNDSSVLSYSMLEHRDLHGDHGMVGSIEDVVHQEYRFMFLLNLCSIILSTMNYYIIFPSAASYCRGIGWKSTNSAILIGSACISALISTVYHIYYLKWYNFDAKSCDLRRLLILSSILPFFGNLLYARSYEYGYFSTAVIGRFLVGFASADLVNKHLVVFFQPKRNASLAEMAKLRVYQILSIFFALLIGSLEFEERQFELYGGTFTLNFETFPGYFMAFAWICLLFGLMFHPFPANENEHVEVQKGTSDIPRGDPRVLSTDHDYSYHALEKTLFARSASDATDGDDYNSIVESLESSRIASPDQHHDDEKSNPQLLFTCITMASSRTSKLVLQNIALSTTFLVYGFASLSKEMLLTSCAIITHRYFEWSGTNAGYFLALLAACLLPTHLVTSHFSTRFGDRVVIKRMLILMLCGIVTFVNYQGLVQLFQDITNIFRQDTSDKPESTYYDWTVGCVQYISSVVVMFICSVSLEGISLSLMSKVSSKRLNRSLINCTAIAPVFSLLGRLLGDTVIVLVGFSHRAISTDMVNSISFILLALCFCCLHVVKKHYFFLNGK